MTTENLVEVVNLLRVELGLIAQGQERLYRLVALVIEDQNKLLEAYNRVPRLRGKSTGKELLN